jgi:ankyrin repeat protein
MFAVSLLATHPLIAAEKLGPTEQKRLNDELIDAVVLAKGSEVISRLLEKGANPDTKYQGSPLLFIPIQAGDTRTAALLLQHGANIKVNDKRGITPLHTAVGKGGKDMVAFLIKHGADVNAKDKIRTIRGFTGTDTPLHIAVDQGNKDMVALLLQHGAIGPSHSAVRIGGKAKRKKTWSVSF